MSSGDREKVHLERMGLKLLDSVISRLSASDLLEFIFD